MNINIINKFVNIFVNNINIKIVFRIKINKFFLKFIYFYNIFKFNN